MAYEWVAPVVTGVVGVVGVAGTLLSAELSRRAATKQIDKRRQYELEDRAHQEKRDAYAAFLGAVNEATRAAKAFDRIRKAPGRAEERIELRTVALSTLSSARGQLRLVGPADVRRCAQAIQRNYTQVLFPGKGARIDWKLNATLLATMKRDLGYELSPEDLEALPPADFVRTEEG